MYPQFILQTDFTLLKVKPKKALCPFTHLWTTVRNMLMVQESQFAKNKGVKLNICSNSNKNAFKSQSYPIHDPLPQPLILIDLLMYGLLLLLNTTSSVRSVVIKGLTQTFLLFLVEVKAEALSDIPNYPQREQKLFQPIFYSRRLKSSFYIVFRTTHPCLNVSVSLFYPKVTVGWKG